MISAEIQNLTLDFIFHLAIFVVLIKLYISSIKRSDLNLVGIICISIAGAHFSTEIFSSSEFGLFEIRNSSDYFPYTGLFFIGLAGAIFFVFVFQFFFKKKYSDLYQ
jgi:hypothetical protein